MESVTTTTAHAQQHRHYFPPIARMVIVGSGEGSSLLATKRADGRRESSAPLIECPSSSAIQGIGGSLMIDAAHKSLSPPAQLRGIVHQFENRNSYFLAQQQQNWQMDMLTRPATTFKCPCCRDQSSEIFCPSCTANLLRLNKVREARRTLFLRKAEICKYIEEQLKEEINFESDFHRKQQFVRQLRNAIAEKAALIQKTKQRIENLELNTGKSKKNVLLLEKKMLAHSDRIARTTIENENHKSSVQKARADLNKLVLHVSFQLLEIFPIKRYEYKKYGVGAEAWSRQEKEMYYLINNAKINEGGVHEHRDYDQLQEELCAAGSSTSLDLTPSARHTFAALVFASQFTETLANLLHCTLPYRHLAGDFSLNTRWTDDLFATAIFKVHYCVTKLCIAQGVSVALLNFRRPFANLFNLMPMLRIDKTNQPINFAFDSKLRMQINEEYQKIKWEERRHDFTLDNVEEDWVSVDFASAK